MLGFVAADARRLVPCLILMNMRCIRNGIRRCNAFSLAGHINGSLLERTLQVALAANAIVRDDCDASQALLDQGINLCELSVRFGLVPLNVAGKQGSPKIIKVLVKNGCGLRKFPYASELYQMPGVLALAARSGNTDELKVWIDCLKRRGESFSETMGRAIRSAVGVGRIDVVQFLQKECEGEFNQAALSFTLLTHAVGSGRLDATEYLLHYYGGFDRAMQRNPRHKGPLYAALHQCPLKTWLPMLSLFLSYGADPNAKHPSLSRTPLAAAIKKGDFESATLLVEYGATIHQLPSMLLSPPLGNASFVGLSLEAQVNKSLRWKQRKYVVRKNGKVTEQIEKILVELGWDEEEVKSEHTDYYVLQYK